jgi:TolB-like protein/Tfp pilus assembly protein PilF
MSGDPEQEYFADGMVEEIITALSRVRWFFVIARNSAFTYKGHAVDVKQIGRELGVRYVLEGSVRKAGNRIRVTAQLVEAETGNHVWAERYDRDLADIFAVQDEITERVVTAIEPELYAAEQVRSQSKPTDSLDAWECVIRALSYFSQSTPDAIAEAEMLCRRAIAIAPGYAQAHSFLAWALVRRATWSGGIAAVLPLAATEAKMALRLDERDPWGHLTNGLVLWRMRRHRQAERSFRRALELNPNFALAYAYLGNTLADLGEHDEAIKSANRALRLSPSDRLIELRVFIARTHAYFAAEHYEASTAEAGNMIERFPEHPWGHILVVATAALQGDMDTAMAALPTALRMAPHRTTVAKLREDAPFVGNAMERFLAGLRKAGLPEE